MACLNFYTIRQWRFISANAIHLLDKMSEEDRQTFYFDVRQINWNEYIHNYVAGTRKYILKDTTTSEKARVVIKKFYLLQKMTHAAILLILVIFGYRLFNLIFGGALLAT